jgi:hypothetical protein
MTEGAGLKMTSAGLRMTVWDYCEVINSVHNEKTPFCQNISIPSSDWDASLLILYKSLPLVIWLRIVREEYMKRERKIKNLSPEFPQVCFTRRTNGMIGIPPNDL